MSSHRCSSCAPGPDRVIDHDRAVINVPRGYRGPPSSMHGGAAAGMAACIGDAHLAAATARLNVRLHGPPPLQTDLPFRVELSDGGHRLRFEVDGPTGIVLSGWAATDTGISAGQGEHVVPPSIVAGMAGRATLTAEQRQRFEDHVDAPQEEFSECFGCGSHNEEGLHLRTRPIDDSHSWIDWTPPARCLDGDVVAALPAIAALDCTSAMPLRDLGWMTETETCLLGTYDGEIHRRPPADIGDSYRIVTAPRLRDGRKIYADIGLFAPDGEVFITGCATWIVLAA